MLLSLRGWGVEEFRLASREFVELARFGLYAEKVAPIIGKLEDVIAMPLATEPTAKLQMAAAKSTAAKELPLWREAIGLDGDDDG